MKFTLLDAPRLRNIALLLGLGTHLYLYGGMVAIVYGWRGETWIFGWKIVTAATLSAVAISLYSYRSMKQLDARYGRGSRWQLSERQVKLPEERH